METFINSVTKGVHISIFQDTLTQVLQILLKSKLLMADDDDVEDLQPSSQIALFLGYKK